jgi:hypothetical protein
VAIFEIRKSVWPGISSKRGDHGKERLAIQERLTRPPVNAYRPDDLRLVTRRDAEYKRRFKLMTNNLKPFPFTIALIYKYCWAIEISFKTIKQYLIVKSFLGTSLKAVGIQLLPALTVNPLAKRVNFLSETGWGLSNAINVVRLHLANHVDIMRLLQWLAESSTKDKKAQAVESKPAVLTVLF